MLWKSRWSGGWSLRRVVDQPNRARIQGNQILISAYDETLNRTCIYNRLRLVNFPVTVGTAIANCPPYRSVRAELPHTAPTLDG
jgi:hypothetical protein